MRIAQNLYWYPWQGRGNNCNTYLIAGEINILIDPGHIHNELRESCLDHLLHALAADRIDPEKIGLILCTHGHPDHCEAAGVMRERSGARLALHRDDEFFLENLKQCSPCSKSPSLKPDFYLQEGELRLGLSQPFEIQVLHTPGHSPGSVCFYLPTYKALISGDTVFKSSVGRTDLPGGDAAALKKSLEKLEALESLELLLPGHMNLIAGAEPIRQNLRIIRSVFF